MLIIILSVDDLGVVEGKLDGFANLPIILHAPLFSFILPLAPACLLYRSATWHQGGDPLHCSGRKPKGREMHSATVLPSSSSFSNSNSSSSDNKTNGGGMVCVCGGRLEDDTIAQDCWLLTVQSKQV